ncbi:MAG: hypothetical protein M1817_005795 [Caeruleum heppii]|nr:MAG: hypothetical protein M1817_005795 [Caeruleum heppii]
MHRALIIHAATLWAPLSASLLFAGAAVAGYGSQQVPLGDVLTPGWEEHVFGPEDQGSSRLESNLLPLVFPPLPLGQIKPQGWLRDQLESMSAGLAGHGYEFYRYVHDSQWLGGLQEYSPLNEGFPYWFNGLVPLAYGLDDDRLKAQVTDAVEIVLSHQTSDGWLGPEAIHDISNIWARFPLLLGLMQVAQANETEEVRIVPAMRRFFRLLEILLIRGAKANFDDRWGKSRAHDLLIALQWLLETHPEGQEKQLLNTMNLLQDQAYDWAGWFQDGIYPKGDIKELPDAFVKDHFGFLHGVNAGQEVIYSLAYLHQAVGDNEFADRCELTTFNALPVMLSPDLWSHQYITLANQPFARDLSSDQTPFWNVGPHGLTYGLEPNYPCCTVNHLQGLPKFLSNAVVKVGTNGLMHALLSPIIATTMLGDGNVVTINCTTHYPFGDILNYEIEADAPFDFHFRVPDWHLPEQSSITVDHAIWPLNVSSAGTHVVHVTRKRTLVTVTLAAEVRVERRRDDSVTIRRGPLLYALDVAQSDHPQAPRDFRHNRPLPDQYITPETEDHQLNGESLWAVAIDVSTLEFERNVTASESLPNPIFASGAPPIWVSVRGCEIEWKLENGVVASPPPLMDRTCKNEPVDFKLIPFGAAKLHMAELPTVQLS